MARMQIRVRGNLEVLAGELAGAILRALPPAAKAPPRGRAFAEALRREMGKELRLRLFTCDTCGALTLCSEALEPLPGADLALLKPGTRPYLLPSSREAERLLHALSAAALRAEVRELGRERAQGKRYEAIRSTLEGALVRHWFRNELCGDNLICREALPVRE